AKHSVPRNAKRSVNNSSASSVNRASLRRHARSIPARPRSRRSSQEPRRTSTPKAEVAVAARAVAAATAANDMHPPRLAQSAANGPPPVAAAGDSEQPPPPIAPIEPARPANDHIPASMPAETGALTEPVAPAAHEETKEVPPPSIQVPVVAEPIIPRNAPEIP